MAARTGAATSHLRLFGVVILCAKVALVPLVFHQAFDVPFVVPKALLSHGLAFLLAGVLLGLLVRSGRAFVLWSWLHVAVLAFLAANILATLFAVDPLLALYGTHNRMLGLGTLADWVVTYFAVVHLIRTRTEAWSVIASAFGASVLVLVYEFVQFTGRDPFSWTLDSAARPFSTLGQATALAQYLTTLGVGGLALGALGRNLGRWTRVALAVWSCLLLAGMTLTNTRSPFLGLASATAVLIGLIWIVHPDKRARVLTSAGGVVAATAIAAVILFTPLGARLLSTIDVSPAISLGDASSLQLEPSAAARLTLYGIALEMLRERPILGYGPDNFVIGVPRYRPDPAPVQVRANVATSAHSWLAQTAATTGVLGLAAFAAIVFGAMIVVARSAFSPLALASAAALGAFLGTGLTTVSEVGTDWLFWISLGGIAAATAQPLALGGDPSLKTRRARRIQRQPRSAGARLPHRVALGCVAVAAVLGIVGVSALGASRWIRDAEDQRLQGRAAQAIELALRSTSTDPRRAEYWHGLGLAYIASGRFTDASVALDRASKLAPYDVRYIGDLARAQLLVAGTGDATARANAIRLGDLAVRTDANNPRAHLTRAVVMSSAGDIPQALVSIERAMDLDPESSDSQLYVTATQILSASGRSSEAIDMARHGLRVLGQSRGSVALRVELARVLVAAGRFTEALAEIDLAVGIQPKDVPALRLQSEIRQTVATAPGARIGVTPTVVAPGDEITVTWSGIPVPTSADWIGVFLVPNPDASYVAWRYTTGNAAGSVTILVPASAEPGSYNVRLFLRSQNKSVAISPPIAVN